MIYWIVKPINPKTAENISIKINIGARPIYIHFNNFIIEINKLESFSFLFIKNNELIKSPNFPINNELKILSKINKTKAEIMDAKKGRLYSAIIKLKKFSIINPNL